MLSDLHIKYGAQLANDGIPLHYGDLLSEYEASLNQAVLLDRSHEGRLSLTGESRFEVVNRISTNKVVDLAPNQGRATIFTNAHARVIDRITVYNRPDDLLVITEPGQGSVMQRFLQKQVFFSDRIQIQSLTDQTRQFAIHGIQGDAVVAQLDASLPDLATHHGQFVNLQSATIYVARRKEVTGSHWAIICTISDAPLVYQSIHELGKPFGLKPAGSLTYNTMRIRAGHPARPELNDEYIPLELGLWDEVSFKKGCYTGQEIIARMESRGKLARTIVALKMDTFLPAPSDIYDGDRLVGKLTSSVQAPDGEIYTMAVVKVAVAQPNTALQVGENRVPASVERLLGTQPESIILD